MALGNQSIKKLRTETEVLSRFSPFKKKTVLPNEKRLRRVPRFASFGYGRAR